MGWESWAKIGLVVGGYALLGPLGGAAGAYLGGALWPTEYETEMPTVGEYQMQSSAIGIPIPIVLGTTKLPGNIIWMGDIDSYEIKHSAGGGKGGGGEQEQTEIKYRRSFIIAICEGPATVLRMWQDKNLKYADSTFDFSGYGSKYESGGFFWKVIQKVIGGAQSPVTFFNGDGNSGISTLIGENYAEYSNVCLAYFEDYELGNSQRIPNFIFEVASASTHCDSYYGSVSGELTLDAAQDFAGQSFTPIFNYNLQSVDLWLKKGSGANVGNVDVELYAVDGSGHPTGSPLCSGVIPNADISEDYSWVNCILDDMNLTFYLLSATTKYCIVVRGDSLSGANPLFWAYGGDGSGYQEGDQEWSIDAGSFWTTDTTTDQLFRCIAPDFLDNYSGTSIPFAGLTLDGSNEWTAQTFTAMRSYTLSGVEMWFRKDTGDNVGDIYVALYNVDDDGHPDIVGGALATGIIHDVDVLETYSWVRCGLSKFNIIVNTKYAIVLHGPSLGASNPLRLAYYNGGGVDGDYLGGNKEWSLTGGATWGTNPTSDNLFRIQGTNFPVGYYYAGDMNFAEMIKDLLINEKCGNYEESDLITADFDDIIAYCESKNLKGSLAITQQKPLPDWIAYICSHFQGYFYEIGGKIGLNCYREQASVLSIVQDDLIRDGDEPPVHTTKRDYSSTFNRLEATWTSRNNDYKAGVVPAFDRIDQREAGQVRTKTLDLRVIHNKELAAKMAWRIFIDQIYRFSQYAFKLGYKSMLLEVGDVIDVTDGHKLVAKKMRVMSISEEKDGRRALISAIEDISGLYPTLEYSIQESEEEGDPIINLTDGTVAFRENYIDNRLFLSITPGGAQCNGFYVYRSYDDESYDLVGKAAIGEVTGGEANSTGTIQSNLPAYTTIVHRKNEAFNVSIGTITDLDTAIADNDFFNNRKIARIGTEIIGYKTCVESATAGIWRVSNLIRGLFGTYPVAHVPGEVFNTLDVDFVYTLRLDDIGKTIYFKVVSFYADEIQLISEVSAYSHVVSGKYKKPLPLSLMRINGREGLSTYKTVDVTLDWYFCSKTSGFGRGGYGNALWGAYEKDLLLERLKVELEEEDGTPIVDGNYELVDYGEPVQLEILEADRNSKNPVRVKITPGSHLWSDGTRNILIEKI